MGAGNHGARPWKPGELAGARRDPIHYVISVERRDEAEVRVDCCEMRFGRLGPKHLHAALLAQTVSCPDLSHGSGFPGLFGFKARVDGLVDVDKLHHVIPSRVIG